MLRIKIGKFALVGRSSERPRGGRRFVLAFVLLATLVYAGVPHTFKDGDTLTASQLNENFQALSAKIDAMEGKSWRLIYETDVTTATTNVNVTGLDGNTDSEYMIQVRWIPNTGGCGLLVRPNNDAATNYGFQRILGANGGVDSSRDTAQTGLYSSSASAGQLATTIGFLYAKTGNARVMQSFVSDSINGTTIGSAGSYTSVWNNSASNITSLIFTGGVANCIGAGSHIEVWARR